MVDSPFGGFDLPVLIHPTTPLTPTLRGEGRSIGLSARGEVENNEFSAMQGYA